MVEQPSDPKKEKSASKKKIEKLNQELKEKNDKLLRCYADLQNLQKRTEKELILREDEVRRKYLSELIEVNELLKKAFEDKNPKEGLKLILQNIENFFNAEKIKSIDCLGKKFDHNLHHAIITVEKNDCDENTIIEEVKKGYLVNDKLLRPSQVIVSKKKEKTEG
jgi:molecular chaperone GrpE